MLPRRGAPAFARVLIIAVLVGAGVQITVSAQQRAPDLDLRSFTPPLVVDDPPLTPDMDGVIIETRTVSVVGPGSAEGGVPMTPLLRVRLVDVSPSTCVGGEPITFDIELQNISRTDLRLPWSMDFR